MQLSNPLPTILLPIETIARELDSNLVLAAALAKRGYRTIVGHKEAAGSVARLSRRVVWLGKDAFELKLAPTSNEHIADHLIARDSPVIFIQEEGGIFPGNEWARLVLEKHRTDYLQARDMSRVCVWGRRQSELLSEHGVSAGVISITGCPRLDLCLPQYAWMQNAKVAEMQSALRPFILMCTRFTSVAHFNGPQSFFKTFAEAPRSESWLDARFATWRRDAHDLADFVTLVKETARTYPERSIVVRPHPSEDLQFYGWAFKPYGNVVVAREGSALDWIRAAELVVHCNCTTGVEAVLAGKPVINFLPDAMPRGDLDKEVAKEAGSAATSIEAAIGAIGEMLRGAGTRNAWSAEARSILNNLNLESIPLLVEQIASVVEESNIRASEVRLPRETIRSVVRRTIGRPSAGETYVAAKRAAFDMHHVEATFDGCVQRGMGAGRIAAFRPDCIIVEPA